MRVRFWGVRGSIPAPGPRTLKYGGNTPCVEVGCGSTYIIIDAGSGIRELGDSLAAAGGPLVLHLLISHTHWDHLQGFPFFTPIYMQGNHVNVYGCQGADRSLEDALHGQMTSPYFPVRLQDAVSTIEFREIDEGEFFIGDVRVVTMFANHPGLCIMYRLEWGGKNLVYMCDNEPYGQLAAPKTPEPEDALVGRHQGVDPRLAPFARDADLLIVDSPYDAEEYERHRGWGHGCVDDVVKIALDANAKRLALFHHEPSHADEKIDEMANHARTLVADARSSMQCFGAAEGMEIDL